MFKRLKHTLLAVCLVAAIAFSCAGSFTLTGPDGEQGRVAHIMSGDEVLVTYVVPNDPLVDCITDTTEWILSVVFGEDDDFLAMGIQHPVNASLVIFFVIQQTEDQKLVPICLTVEDQTRPVGQKTIRAWWYDGDCTKYPIACTPEELLSRLKKLLGVDDNSSI